MSKKLRYRLDSTYMDKNANVWFSIQVRIKPLVGFIRGAVLLI